jgi:DNA-binding NtrC family response regulator
MREMAWERRIALVDDDQNILTSVSLTLESEGFEAIAIMMARQRFAALPGVRLSLPFSTSRCRAWTAWSCCRRSEPVPAFR